MHPIKQLCSISGMQCGECALNIETAVQSLPGVIKAAADFGSETVNLEYDADVVDLNAIRSAIKQAGYDCKPFVTLQKPSHLKRIALFCIALLGIAALLSLDKFVEIDLSLQDLQGKADYPILFMIGVLTSFHCIGMCGGFVLGYAGGSGLGKSAVLRHLAYGFGKTLSYTGFGALFGLLGGFIAFTIEMRALVLAAAGLFLVVYGLSMLQAFAGLRRFQFRTPKFVYHLVATRRRGARNPFSIGLLNGLMIACGPLQAMYVTAASTGSAVQGATMLLFFALGTLPVMLAFGFFASLATAETGKRLLRLSAFLILLLGAVMINRGLTLLGSGYDVKSLAAKVVHLLPKEWPELRSAGEAGSLVQNGYQVVYMEVDESDLRPSHFSVKKDYPVRWIIDVKKLSPCTKQLVIPSLQKTIDLHEGLQMLEFQPEQAGAISWSCSMGMISGSFTVED